MQSILCALPKLPISYTTIVSIIILLIGLIIGAKRGLIKSVFSIITSIGALAVGIFITPYIGNFLLQQNFIIEMGELGIAIANILSFLIGWLGALLILKLLFHLLNKLFTGDNIIGSINRVLGALFGVASAFITIIVVTYLISIFQSFDWAQTVVLDAQTDGFGKFLFNNNLVEKFLELLSKNIPEFGQFMESINKIMPPQIA